MKKSSLLSLLIAGLAVASLSMAAPDNAMPVAEQNALVGKYCAVCHTDARPNGGLSLEHFDAAHINAGTAAMIVSKLKSSALGASGQPLPDKTIQDQLLKTISAEAAGAHDWIVDRNARLLTASIVQETPSASNSDNPDLYRLTLTCGAATREAGMQLAWSPGVPKDGTLLSAAVDGKAPATYKVEGVETMGNGTSGTSGPGSIMLHPGKLPERNLTIGNVFPNETIVFPFDALAPDARQALSKCFKP